MPNIISVHGDKCGFDCPHAAVCYHRRKDEQELDTKTLRKIMIDIFSNVKDAEVYISVCSYSDFAMCSMLASTLTETNVNFTLPVTLWRANKAFSAAVSSKLQVTVYNMEDIIEIGNDVQKLYLIKDDETFNTAMTIMTDESVSNIHFPIDQNYATKENLTIILKAWKKMKDTTITIDSCLENFVVHGKCVYSDNYVDVNYDGTYRKCVFEKKGFKMRKDLTLNDMINTKYMPKCIYSKLFSNRGK